MIQLFRVLLPSWKFFDRAVQAPELWCRTSSDGTLFSDWWIAIPKIKKRSWKNLFINAEENFHFAAHALLEYFEDDLRGGVDPQISLELIRNLARFQIHARPEFAHSTHFQFSVARMPEDRQAYRSETYRVGES